MPQQEQEQELEVCRDRVQAGKWKRGGKNVRRVSRNSSYQEWRRRWEPNHGRAWLARMLGVSFTRRPPGSHRRASRQRVTWLDCAEEIRDFQEETMFSGAKAISRTFVKEERQTANKRSTRRPSLLVTRDTEIKTARDTISHLLQGQTPTNVSEEVRQAAAAGSPGTNTLKQGFGMSW